jgi:hypothetical protein
MATKLYKDDLPELEAEFRKEAAYAARVSETPENWPQELTSELYKQLPYISDYEVNVNLDRVDPGRGFAFGYADIASKTERPEVEHDEAGIPHIRVPLIIEERSVRPFATYLDGEKVMPLTEERIRETLFNPGTFDLSVVQPRDPSLVEPLMPPQRSGMGQGGEYKMASVDEQLMAVLMGKEKQAGVSTQKMESALEKADNPGKRAYLRSRLMAKQYGHQRVSLLDGGGREAKATAKLLLRGLKKHAELDLDRRATDLSGMKVKAAMGPGMMGMATQAGIKGMQAGGEQAAKAARVAFKLPNHGAAGAAAGKMILGKTAEVDLFHAIAPTLRESDVERVIAKIAESKGVQVGLKRAGVVDDLVEILDKTKRASASERLEYIASHIEPTVVTVHKFPGGEFLIKSAAVGALDPSAMQGQVVDQQQAGAMIGDQNAQTMQPGQTATIVPEPVNLDQEFESSVKPVDEFGEYKVMDTMGNQLMGWVFPRTLAWDGAFTPQPMALFTNGSAYAAQDSIAGEFVGKSTNLPNDPKPVGDGVFYTVQGGSAVCTQPVTVKSAMAGPDGQPKMVCADMMGQQLVVSFMDGIAKPQRMSDTEYALPMSWKFMRVNNQTQLQGSGGPEIDGAEQGVDDGGMNDMLGGEGAPKKPAAKKPGSSEKKPEKKESKLKEKSEEKPAPKVEVNVNEKPKKEKTASTVVLWYNGGYNIEGGCGLRKLAADQRYDMSPVDAEFMLGLLGVDGHVAKQKVAEARRKGSVKLAGLRTIVLLGERFREAEKTAAALYAQLPDLRKDLVKEAAVLQDKTTVNDLLALNFINPENLDTFVSYVPELEETSERLAEMLLYSQLGMNELPEGAITRSMKAVEDVLVNLKNLSETGAESAKEE